MAKPKRVINMKYCLIGAFLIFLQTTVLSQRYLVAEDAESSCIIYQLTPDFSKATLVDTLYHCSSCTLVGNLICTLNIDYESFDGNNLITIRQFRVMGKKFKEIALIGYRFNKRIRFNRYNFYLSNGFLYLVYRDEKCVKKCEKSIALAGLTQAALNTFVDGFMKNCNY
jgi:hypothetical protein